MRGISIRYHISHPAFLFLRVPGVQPFSCLFCVGVFLLVFLAFFLPYIPVLYACCLPECLYFMFLKRACDALEEEGFEVVPYHKDIVPLERMQNLQALRSGRAKILVCTDLAAR